MEDGPWLVKKAFIKKPMLMLGQGWIWMNNRLADYRTRSRENLELFQTWKEMCGESFTVGISGTAVVQRAKDGSITVIVFGQCVRVETSKCIQHMNGLLKNTA